MLERFQLLRNVGQFDNVIAGAQLAPLAKLTLIYAENGRGKTTLASILRSASADTPALILERRRLGSAHPPEVILGFTGGTRRFQNDVWSAASPEIAIFDDAFVAANVCSGIDIETGHRQNLHELILGAPGVALNAVLVDHVTRIEEHNRALRQREAAIPANVRGALTVDQFCALPEEEAIDAKITEAERTLAAARSAAAIAARAPFTAVALPTIDAAAINQTLGRSLADVGQDAMVRVAEHLGRLGEDAENWIGDGVKLIPKASEGRGEEVCPFCVQGLRQSPIIAHYQAYFSAAYEELKAEVQEISRSHSNEHRRDVQTAFERSVREAGENLSFWGEYMRVPHAALDTASIALLWNSARDGVRDALKRKTGAPLEVFQLSEEVARAIDAYSDARAQVVAYSDTLIAANADIALVKERAAGADVATATADVTRLKLVRTRHAQAIRGLCDAYLAEKAAKVVTEALRDQARRDLDNYRQNVFPAYEASINDYLGRFGAAFRLHAVQSVNTRSGSSCTYSVIINQVPVPLTAAEGASFRNTLSAGDRNTLALAFFFASLEQLANLAQAIVIIDDPMTSLDEHRSLATVHEIRLLEARVRQVILLSHFKPYLCELWQGADTTARRALMIRRDGQASSLIDWDVHQDCITEHDKRHALVAAFAGNGNPADERAAAAALRPILEAFLRVAYPEHCPPGTLLGAFLNRCQQRVGTPNEIMTVPMMAELETLKNYGNRFHHDTNPAWQTQAINGQELTGFCTRVLTFIRK